MAYGKTPHRSRARCFSGTLVKLAGAVAILASAPAWGADAAIDVGVIAPLSGNYGRFGTSIADAMKLQRREALTHSVRLHFEDNPTCAAPDAVAAFKKLSEIDKCTVVVTFCTAAAKALLPLAKAKNLPLIQLTAAEAGDDTFMIKMMPDAEEMLRLVATQHLRWYSRVAVVGNTMEVNSGPHGNLAVYRKFFEGNGGIVTFSEEFPTEASDFRALIAKIKRSGAQAISPFIFDARQMAQFLKQADELKLWDTVSLAGNFIFELMYDELRAIYPRIATMEGLISANFRDTTSPAFREEFKRAYHSEPVQFSDYAYDVMSMLGRCGAEMECLREPFDGVSGAVRFDKFGRRQGAFEVRRLRNGRFVAD